MVHIFVYVVRSLEDPFDGIRCALLNEAGHQTIDIRLSESDLDLVNRVEFSERKYFRVFFYQKIFSDLVLRLKTILNGLNGRQANVYFSDEGVWALLWMDVRQNYSRQDVRGVNVQHGFGELRVSRYLGVRRMVNLLSRLFARYPCLGLGSLGGAGPDAFDIYLTYDEKTADFIRRRTARAAIACPKLIKASLIHNFRKIAENESGAIKRVLFALQPRVIGSAIKCSVSETFDALLDLARALNEFEIRFVIRLHPGMDQSIERERFFKHPISSFSELDQHTTLHQSMAKAQMVMSFYSTLLWEAGLLGITAVQVVCDCCDLTDLGYECKTLELGGDLKGKLSRLINAELELSGFAMATIESEWARVRTSLLS